MADSLNIVVTGATGHLGKLVLAELHRVAPNAHLIGLVRDRAKGQDLAAHGVEVRVANYDDPASLEAALAGADRLVLISANEVGKRLPQHTNVINAAKKAGVKFIAYTSILRADTTPMALASEHKATEALIKASGIPFAFLRNGWYTENYLPALGAAVAHGAVIGASGNGKISAATRADYAAAAATVIAGDVATHSGKAYELAGDDGFTLAQWAAEIAKQSGKQVVFNNLSEADYKATLQGFGLPEGFAAVLADSDAKAANGALFDDSHTLSRLIGRPTTPWAETLRQALKA